jgi:cell division protease FtsH
LNGWHFCAVSSAPERFLPEELIRTVDHRLRVGPIMPDLVRTVAGAIASGAASVNLDAAACASLTPDMLRLGLRAQQSADDYIRRLAALAEAPDKRAEAAITLDDLYGMDAAVAWGRDLAQDLAEYRCGTLPWAAVDRGAMLVGPRAPAR